MYKLVQVLFTQSYFDFSIIGGVYFLFFFKFTTVYLYLFQFRIQKNTSPCLSILNYIPPLSFCFNKPQKVILKGSVPTKRLINAPANSF